MGGKSREKGRKGELELTHELTRLFGVEVRRGVQHCGGPDSPDVIGLPNVHVECKRTEKLTVYDAIDQASGDAGGKVPVVMHRKNQREWLAIVRLEDLPALATHLYLTMQQDAGCVTKSDTGEDDG